MVDWFTKAHDLLVATGLRKSQIGQAVHESVVDLRSGFTTFLRKLEAAAVPTLIFSAGLAGASVHTAWAMARRRRGPRPARACRRDRGSSRPARVPAAERAHRGQPDAVRPGRRPVRV